MALESSTVRSVNSGVICGAVTRRMRKPNTPTSVTVTAAMALSRAAPSVLKNTSNPCTGEPPTPGVRRLLGKICPVHGFHSVNGKRANSEWRMANGSDCARRTPHHSLFATRYSRGRQPALLPILLDSRGAQAGEAVPVDGILPGEEFFDRQRVTATGFLEREESAAHGGHHFGLAADDPPLGAGCRQIGNGERTSVRPNHILSPRTMGLAHMQHSHTQRLLDRTISRGA